jgi:two-component system chemotaxis family response regulator WspR
MDRLSYRMPILTSMALVAILLAIGGYAAGAWRSRIRERELTEALADRNEELQAARAEIARLSSQDPLTSLASYPHFQQFFEGEWRRASRELTPISLIAIELDHFNSYRERLGEDAANACLKRVAAILRDDVGRPGDLVGRHDRDRFLVVLARTDGDGAHALAVKLRAAVEALELPHPVSPVATYVTISLGVATAVPSRGSTWQEIELLAASDRALTDAKRLGCNRVSRAEFIAG